jgi:hypothetical protein
MSKNGRPAACEVPGCRARVHGNGQCRRHYDEDRYLQTTGRSPEAVAGAQREQAIEGELTLGCVAEWRSPYGTNSMFADDEERRAAWEERREALMVNYLTPPLRPGRRPFAWWRYEAQRPAHLSDYPPRDFETPQDERAAALDEYEIEPVAWMAAHGHPTDEELAKIAERANEARPRIGTPAEHIGSGGVDRADRRAVKLYEAVERARRASSEVV